MTTAVNETRENCETGESLQAAEWSAAERQRNEEWMAQRFAQEDRWQDFTKVSEPRKNSRIRRLARFAR
jgi:hypothetical protein